jgi:subtilisin family serine protease
MDEEVIVKYNGNITKLGFQTELLNDNYAVITLPESDIPKLDKFTEIEYVEKSKRLTLSVSESADYICINDVRSKSGYGLTGKGTLIAVIDSGIDYRHKDFRNPDGTSRIVYIWDQTIDGKPPNGFLRGTEYTNEQINNALASSNPLEIVPHQDNVGHGTAVAGHMISPTGKPAFHLCLL